MLVVRWRRERMRRGEKPVLGLSESKHLASLIQELGKVLRGHTTIFCHVASHTGKGDFASYYNDLADKAATAALGPRPPPRLG
jgi:hypothetical protein